MQEDGCIESMNKCNHSYPWKYVTRCFLMCDKCKGKIRKLTHHDIESMELAKTIRVGRYGLRWPNHIMRK